MAKEWILNSATNRFQLNFKRNVGPTSESIRRCAPKSMEEWRTYYFTNVRSHEHIESLGKKLFVKISEVIRAEVDDITEEDCIRFITELVIDRTFEGYQREIKTIYEQLATLLDVKIEPASDEWDRRFGVDFFIKIGEQYIGIQIKPVHQGIQLAEIFKEKQQQLKAHAKFTKQFGGAVFYVYSAKEGERKEIVNPEVVEEIRNEIIRLKQSS